MVITKKQQQVPSAGQGMMLVVFFFV